LENLPGAGIAPSDLEKAPADGAAFEDVPPDATKAKSFQAWNKNFVDYLYEIKKWNC
jgi:hypothetical protein